MKDLLEVKNLVLSNVEIAVFKAYLYHSRALNRHFIAKQEISFLCFLGLSKQHGRLLSKPPSGPRP